MLEDFVRSETTILAIAFTNLLSRDTERRKLHNNSHQ